MLRIDCLLKDTEILEDLRTAVQYLGSLKARKGEDASFRTIYNELRKAGVEVDAETTAKVYETHLTSTGHEAFTKSEDLQYETGTWFDRVIRNLTLQKPKEGEKEISELSPSQAAVKTIADAFSNNVTEDHTTKSILKTLEDLYREGAKRMLGELPNKPDNKDLRSTKELVEQALENETIGYRNQTDGTINNLAKIHEEVRKQIKQLTKEMEQTEDHDKIEQWNNYAKSLEDATYTMLFKSNDAKQILHDSLKEQGFVKTTKDGKELLDWQKLAGNINSYDQLRENVVDNLKKQGFPEEVGHRVADSMSKEFKEIRGKILDTAEKKQERLVDSWSKTNTGDKESIGDLVEKRVKDWQNLTKFEGKENEPLKFSKNEAKRIIGDVLKNSEKYGRDFSESERAVDWLKMAQEKPSQIDLDLLLRKSLKEPEAAAALSRDYHQTLMEDIDLHSTRALDARQKALERDTSNRKSDLARLGELHDLGLFNGAHDQLLARVLGIDPQDVHAIQGIKVYAEKISKLRQLLSGNDFLVPSLTHTLNREIHSIIAPLISNRTKAMKVVSAINKIYQVENSLLISTHGNILENHLSGLTEMLTSNLSQRLKLGSEVGGFKAQDRRLMADVYAHVAAGGAENGLAPYQVGGNKERVTDKYNFHKLRGADWSKPETWARGVATGILSIPRAFLSGADGSIKAGLMNTHMKSGVIDAIVASSEGNISKDEAVKIYNDAIYGDGQFEQAKIKAEQLYKNIGLDYVSQRELNITAHELLRENLLQDNRITPEALEEVMKNSFHQAGLGMGHESNNWVSKQQQAYKSKLNREENKAVADNDWDKAYRIRRTNTIINDVLLRFAASRCNWAYIRAEQAGLGLITGIRHYSITDSKYKNIDLLADTEKANEAAVEYQKARQKFFRGAVGLAINASAYGITKMIANTMNPNEEDPTKAMFESLKDNYFAKSLYLKVAPLWLLQSYEYNDIKNDNPIAKSIGGGLADVANLTGLGDKHDLSIQVRKSIDLIRGKTDKSVAKGFAQLGLALNNFIPHIPLARQTKNVLELVDWSAGKEPQPRPPYPANFAQGLFYGGVVQDVFEMFPEDQLPESFQAWGKTAPVQSQ